MLQKIEMTIADKDDPRLLQNLRLAESAKSGFRDVQLLREGLTAVRNKIRNRQLAKEPQLDAALTVGGGVACFVGAPETVIVETLKLLRNSDTDTSTLLYNLSALHFERKEYAAARSVLEYLFRDIEPIEETVAVYVCLLLLDVLVHCSRGALLAQQDRVAFAQQSEQVLDYMEKLAVVNQMKMANSLPSGTTASSPRGYDDDSAKASVKGSENGGAAGVGGDGSEERMLTPAQAADLDFRLHLYRAKVLLMQHHLKASKKEIKSALEFLPKSRELSDSPNTGKGSAMTAGNGQTIESSTESLRNITALYLKANFEYLRQNYRKALKLLSSSHTTSGMMQQLAGPDQTISEKLTRGNSEHAPNKKLKGVVGATYLNNVACVHHKMCRPHLSVHYFKKAIAECVAANNPVSDEEGSGISAEGRPHLNVDCEVRYNCGLQLLLTEQPQAAMARFEEATPLFYNRPLLWLRMAECCLQRHLQLRSRAESIELPGKGGSNSLTNGGIIATGMAFEVCGSPGKTAVIGAGAQRRILLNASPRWSRSASFKNQSTSASGLNALQRDDTSLQYASKCLQNVLYLCASLKDAASKKASQANEGKLGIFGKKLTGGTEPRDGDGGESKSEAGVGTAGSRSSGNAFVAVDGSDRSGSAAEAAAAAASAASAEAAVSAATVAANTAAGSASSSGGHGGASSSKGTSGSRGGDALLSEDAARTFAPSLQATALLDLAYVHLALNNPVTALQYTLRLLSLRGPAAPPHLQFIGHLYAAEALCQLNKPAEALEHIATGE